MKDKKDRDMECELVSGTGVSWNLLNVMKEYQVTIVALQNVRLLEEIK